MTHELALITPRRVICRCGWHKKTAGKESGRAAMVRHVTFPAETPGTPTVTDHRGEGCNIQPINEQWSACTTHNRYLIPDTEPVPQPITGQTEMSFT